MAQKTFISTEDKIITSELLCFLRNKLPNTANDDIVTACCNFYSDEYVQNEKETFYSAIGKKTPRPRVADKKARDVNDLLQEMRLRDDIGEWQPKCVATDLANLPKTEIGNVSNSQIFDSLLSLRKNVVSRNELNNTLLELKSELIMTMKSCIRPASFSSPRHLPRAPCENASNLRHNDAFPAFSLVNLNSSVLDDRVGDGFESSVGAVFTRVGNVPTRVGDVPTSVGAVPTTVGAVPSSVGAVPSSFGAVPSSVGAVNTSVGAVPTSVGAIPTSVGAVPSSVGAVPASVGAVPASVGAVPSSVGAVPTSVGAVPTSVGAVPTSVGAVPTSVGAVPTSVGAVPTSVGAVPTTVGVDPTSVGSHIGAIRPLEPLGWVVPSSVGVVPSSVGVVPTSFGAVTTTVGAT